MWDHWRGGIFTDSETLNDENKLLKCIAEKQRKEMILLAKQIAALAKRKDQIDDKKENSNVEQVSADPSVELEQGQYKDDQSKVVTWDLDAETNDTNPTQVPVEPVPAIPAPNEPVPVKLATISTPQSMKTPKNFPIICSILHEPTAEKPEPIAIPNPPKMVQFQIVQIVPTLQPQFRIEALRKQPRKIAPKRSRSPDLAERSQPIRKTRKLRNITAKQQRSNV